MDLPNGVKDNLGLTKPKGQGFSKERMDLFKELINTVVQIAVAENRPIWPGELNIPKKANTWDTIEKAIQHYAVPNGICVTADPGGNVLIYIRTKEQYAEYSREMADQIQDLTRRKEMASAAWMNDRRKLIQ